MHSTKQLTGKAKSLAGEQNEAFSSTFLSEIGWEQRGVDIALTLIK